MAAIMQSEYGIHALKNKAVYSATRCFEDTLPLKPLTEVTDFAKSFFDVTEFNDREGIYVYGTDVK